jgi:ATP-dependent Clp protease adaptor protein ClpS
MGTSTEVFEEVKIDEKIKKEAREPGKYKVVMLNDETTPMEWVIGMLTTIFGHSQETAEKLTLQIHSEGSGIAGIYTYEIAEQKSVETINASRDRGFPLQVRIDSE